MILGNISGGGGQGGTVQGLEESIQTIAALFCADYVLVASLESARLQVAFDVLTGLFDQVGLCTNEGKTVSMAFWPCRTPHAWPTEAYTQRVKGRGIIYRERLHQRVHYP